MAAALGLLIWLVLGTVIVTWYDRKHLYRLQPDVLTHVSKSVQDYKAKQAAQAQPTDEADPSRPQPG